MSGKVTVLIQKLGTCLLGMAAFYFLFIYLFVCLFIYLFIILLFCFYSITFRKQKCAEHYILYMYLAHLH